VLRACGLRSSASVGKGASVVSAELIGDPQSRSRAIILRVGSGKADSPILWASRRDGLLCSCFSGTQNALFLSASARSTTCRHTSALLSCLSDTKIPFTKFWTRMHLGSQAADFAIKKQEASVSWVVLYRSVYSLVSFTAANAATCIAPSCRRFRSRCSHVNLARPLNNAYRAAAENGESSGMGVTLSTVKAARSADRRPALDGIPDDDAGIDKEAPDKARGSADDSEAIVADRVRRNMLPCSGEISEAEVWARTADWRGILLRQAAADGNGRQHDLTRLTSTIAELHDLASSTICAIRRLSRIVAAVGVNAANNTT